MRERCPSGACVDNLVGGIVATDPLAEEAHAALIRVLAAAGVPLLRHHREAVAETVAALR